MLVIDEVLIIFNWSSSSTWLQLCWNQCFLDNLICAIEDLSSLVTSLVLTNCGRWTWYSNSAIRRNWTYINYAVSLFSTALIWTGSISSLTVLASCSKCFFWKSFAIVTSKIKFGFTLASTANIAFGVKEIKLKRTLRTGIYSQLLPLDNCY